MTDGGEGGESGGDGGRKWCPRCRLVSLLSCRCPVTSSGCYRGAWCQQTGLGRAGDGGCSPFVVWVPRCCGQRGTCFPCVRWLFLCVCASVRICFGVLVVVRAVRLIVGVVVAVVVTRRFT